MSPSHLLSLHRASGSVFTLHYVTKSSLNSTRNSIDHDLVGQKFCRTPILSATDLVGHRKKETQSGPTQTLTAGPVVSNTMQHAATLKKTISGRLETWK